MTSSFSGRQGKQYKKNENETVSQEKLTEPAAVTTVRIKVSPFYPSQDQSSATIFSVHENGMPRSKEDNYLFESFWFLLRYKHYP